MQKRKPKPKKCEQCGTNLEIRVQGAHRRFCGPCAAQRQIDYIMAWRRRNRERYNLIQNRNSLLARQVGKQPKTYLMKRSTCRAILVQAAIDEGLTRREAAEILGTTEGTVQHILAYARLKARVRTQT
jgi:DNA-directed RNA polymerase specialized sigma24 family protein